MHAAMHHGVLPASSTWEDFAGEMEEGGKKGTLNVGKADVTVETSEDGERGGKHSGYGPPWRD
jgi:hypothetical protein